MQLTKTTRLPAKKVAVGLCAACVLLASSGAWAKPAKAPTKTPSPSAAATRAGPKSLGDTLEGPAKGDYDAGKMLYSDGDFASAMIKFQSAYDRSHDPRLLWNMGACQKSLRHYAKVTALVARYLADGGDLLTDQDRQDAKDLLAAIESFTAYIRLTVNERGAQVFVDDELVGTTPLAQPVMVDIGLRKITIKKPGFYDYSSSVPVGGSKEVTFDVKLDAEIHQGRLTIHVPANADVSLDGKVIGHGGWTGEIPSGAHSVLVVAPGMRAYQTDLSIQDKETRTVDVTLEPLVLAPPVAPPEPPPGPSGALELGLRSGYGWRGGNGGVNDIPVAFDIGYRSGSRVVFFGGFFEYAALDKSGTCGTDLHGATATSGADFQARYALQTCQRVRAGLALQFHTLPHTIVDPWIGIDMGYQHTNYNFNKFDPLTGNATSGSTGSDDFISELGIGIDVHPWKGFDLGPYFKLGVSIGDGGNVTSKLSDSQSNQSSSTQSSCPTGSTPSNQGCSTNNQDQNNKSPLPMLQGGLRVAYTF